MARAKETQSGTKTKKKSSAAVKPGKTKSKSAKLIAFEKDKAKMTLLAGWARDGLSMEQIAHNMGIVRSTLNEWMRLSSDISDTIKKNKEVADYEVENALYQTAISGNVAAQIFILKNRRPDKWRDKVIEQEKEDDNTGLIEIAPVIEKGSD